MRKGGILINSIPLLKTCPIHLDTRLKFHTGTPNSQIAKGDTSSKVSFLLSTSNFRGVGLILISKNKSRKVHHIHGSLKILSSYLEKRYIFSPVVSHVREEQKNTNKKVSCDTVGRTPAPPGMYKTL